MEAHKRAVSRWRVFGTFAGVALAGTVGAGLLASRRPLVDGRGEHEKDVPTLAAPTRRLHEKVEKMDHTWPKQKCMTYPWLFFEGDKPLYNNLANKGDRSGVGDGEGLVYRTTAMGTGWGVEMGKKVLLILNGTNANYEPFSPHLNGRQGFYGSVNLQSGSHLHLKISFKDEETGKPLVLEQIAMTFFDIDMAHDWKSRESVAANKFKRYFVTPDTETKLFKVPGAKGLYKFSASTFGDGTDNPQNPSALTPQQKNRAVTFLFENVDEVDVTVAATPNTEVSPRFFTFVMRPSLLCAITLTKGQKKPENQLSYSPPMEYAVPCGEGMYFERWLKRVNDPVKEGEGIAVIKTKEGKFETMKAQRSGTILKTVGLLQGESCDTRLMDTTIAVVKMDLLPALPGDPAAVGSREQTFVKYVEKVGTIVEKDNPIAVVDSPDGQKELKAPHEGYISAEQTLLRPGDPIEMVEDKNLASFGKLPPLAVTPGEGPANAPTHGNWMFKEWKVDKGDSVKKDDPVAVLEDSTGSFKTVRASKDGTIVERQEEMKPGYKIDRVMSDKDLATIGKFKELKPEGWRGVAIKAPTLDAYFKKWHVHKGDYVEKGDPIADIEIRSRRLADGRMLQGQTTQITSPAWGTVKQEQPLVPGEKIGDQQLGPNIATLDMGTPWWTWLLAALLLLCCLLCCIFCAMAKPKPAYTPMPPVEEPPPPPDGLRLDFEEAGVVHTVYAKYRPLGIKHNDIAPIIAHEFTVNSYAKQDLGVKQGWKLRRIGDEELNDNPNFGEVNSKLHDWMKDFPLWPLPMIFQDGAVDKDASFVERPLGIEFTNSAPIHVSKVYDGSPASEQGIKEGWTVAKIGDMDVRKDGNFRQVMGYFHEGVQPLDNLGKTYS